jgi:hypothetical protein
VACGQLIVATESKISGRSPSRQTTQAAQLCARAVDSVATFLQSLLDSFTSPSEAPFGLTSIAIAEFDGDLGLEGAALVTGKATGP